MRELLKSRKLNVQRGNTGPRLQTLRLDLPRDFDRELQSGSCFISGYARSRSLLCTLEKRPQLARERIVSLDLHRLSCDPTSPNRVNFSSLILIVKGEIGVLLKHAELAHFFRADSAHREIRNTAVLETESCIGNVFTSAQHGNANSIDALDRRADKMQNNLEIVYHEVEDNPDLDASVRIR